MSANALFCTTIEFLQEGDLEGSLGSAELGILDASGLSLPAGTTTLGDSVPFDDNGRDLGPIEDDSLPCPRAANPIRRPPSPPDGCVDFQPRVFS